MSITKAFGLFIILSFAASCQAKLILHLDSPEQKGAKVLIKMVAQNTFTEVVESARATIFLFDKDNKVVGKETRWVIGGGGGDKKVLEPGKEAVYYFVINSEKPFARSELLVNQVILKGGKSVNLKDAYTVEPH